MSKPRKCLLCSTASLTTIVQGSDSKVEVNTVENQVKTIFVLRKLLRISFFDCSEILRNEETNPSSWFFFCWKCLEEIADAENTFRELIKLELKWKTLQESFMTKVRCGISGNSVSIDEKEEYRNIKIRKLAIENENEKGPNSGPSLDEAICNSLATEQIKSEIPYYNSSDEEVDEFLGNHNGAESPDSENVESDNKCALEDATTAPVKRTTKRQVRRSRSGRIIKSNRPGMSSMFTTAEDSDFSEPEKTKQKTNSRRTKVKVKKSVANISKRVHKRELKDEDSSNLEDTLFFNCAYCSNLYSNENGKNDHENRSHGTNHAFHCTVCPKSYGTLHVLYRHYSGIHRIEPDRNHGRILGDGSRRKLPDRLKIKKEHIPPSLDCKKCGKVYTSLSALRYHEQRCKGPPNIFCSFCKMCFTTETKLRLHVYKIHDKNQLPFPCSQCDKKFTLLGTLKRHTAAIHLKQKDYICEICSKGFSHSNLLQYHQIKFHGVESDELTCKECGKVMCNPASLRNHISGVHKRQHKFKCPICNVGRISQSGIDAHVLMAHTNCERPHVCSFCGKSYISSFKLRGHMRTHTNERPFHCKLCSKAFFTVAKLKRHERGVHFSDKIPFECQKCDKKFPSRHYLNYHVYRKHNKKKSRVTPKQLADLELLKKLVETKPNTPKNVFRLKIKEKLFKNENDAEDTPTSNN